MTKPIDFSHCYLCQDKRSRLTNYYGFALCAPCIKLEEETDWDQYEINKRQRIAKQNEE
ncbi:MAG: hypothetical protein ACI843_001571 [Psychrobacter glaciei]|jgi:hypothetical protein